MRTPHTSCQQGQRVIIKTKDGLEYRGKFFDRTAKHVVFYGGLQIPAGSIFDLYDKEARTLCVGQALEVWNDGKLVSRCQYEEIENANG